MKPIKRVDENEVWEHWKKVEKFSMEKFRWDIREQLVEQYDMQWFLAEIEKEDLEKIFIISSDDWLDFTPTFRIQDAVSSLDNQDEPHVKNILEKRKIFEDNINGLDRKLIFVSPSPIGNFTIIEGNKRAVALLSLNKLVGNQVYLGISKQILHYWWARKSK